MSSSAIEISAARESASSRRSIVPLAVFVAVAAWTALVYLPFYRLDGPDDAFYVEAAHLWTRGAPLYVGAFDIKAPGFFAVLAAAQLVFGASLATLRGVTIVFTAIAATALYGMSRPFCGRVAAIVCATLFPILLEIYGDAAYAVLCGFTSLAFLAALSPLPPERKAALAGLAIGAACCVKQTAALEALVLMWIIVGSAAAEGKIKTGATFVGFASLAPLGFLAYYTFRGDLGVLHDDAVVFALQRPQSATDGISFAAGLRRSLTLQTPIFPVTLLAIFALARWRTLDQSFPIGLIAAWLAAAFVSSVLQHALSAYYLAPALTPLLLLASAGLVKAVGARGGRSLGTVMALFGALTVTTAVTLRGGAIVHNLQPVDQKAIDVAAAAIEATRPLPSDRLFAVSRGGWLNVTTDLAPPTPYFHWFHTLCDFPGAGAGRLAEALATRPRFLVVADPSKRFQCELDSHRTLIDAALASSYRLLVRADGDHDFYGVYERK
jgi:hypothetical protein